VCLHYVFVCLSHNVCIILDSLKVWNNLGTSYISSNQHYIGTTNQVSEFQMYDSGM